MDEEEPTAEHDAESRREFITTLEVLADMLADRLDNQVVEAHVRSPLECGEEGVALDNFAAELQARRPTVTVAEQKTIHRLLHHYDLEDLDPEAYPSIHDRDAVLAALTVVDP